MIPHFATTAKNAMLPIAGIALGGLVVTYIGVACLRYWAERHGVVDIPNERSSHSQPTPRGGGLAIVVVVLGGWWCFALLDPVVSRSAALAYVVGASVIAAAGWLDDIRPLSNRLRFAVQSFGAILTIWGLGYWHIVSVPVFGQVHLGWLGPWITFLWIVGLTNAYNFMDGIDGIAGGQAVVAGLAWALLAWMNGHVSTSLLALLLAASSLGFLAHNWPPARIFMGDVGSAFLGYTLAILPLINNTGSWSGTLPIGVLLLWPFVFDTGFTFFRRLCKRENVFTAHRSHLYQRLVISGRSHLFVTLLYIALALFGAVLASIWSMRSIGSHVAVALLLPLVCLILVCYVVRQEQKRAPARTSSFTFSFWKGWIAGRSAR